MMPNTSPHIALVVSPLRALIFDQVTRCLEAGINAVALTTQHEMSAEAMQSKLLLRQQIPIKGQPQQHSLLT